MRRGRGAGATPRSLLPDHVGAPRLVALSLAAIDDGEEAKPIIDRFGNPMMLPRGAAKTKTRRPSSARRARPDSHPKPILRNARNAWLIHEPLSSCGS